MKVSKVLIGPGRHSVYSGGLVSVMRTYAMPRVTRSAARARPSAPHARPRHTLGHARKAELLHIGIEPSRERPADLIDGWTLDGLTAEKLNP